MAIELEGGTLVADLREGEPLRHGTLRSWSRFGRASGAEAISLRVLELEQGLSPTLAPHDAEELLYVLAGRGTLFLDGHALDVEPDTGVFRRPGSTLALENAASEPLVIASARCPEPEDGLRTAEPRTEPSRADGAPAPAPLVRLAERPTETTAERWYRVLVNEDLGCRNATQFVGSIPPGRAADHFHLYEEVLVVLRGEGRMWSGGTHTPIRRASCIFLPREQVHCLENTGPDELLVLGVFHPSGSPAAAYERAERRRRKPDMGGHGATRPDTA